MKITARVDASAVERALRGVAGIGPDGVPRAVRAAIEPSLEELRRATPVDTGALRESVRAVVLQRGDLTTGTVGWSTRRRVRAAQMLAVEFGNRHRPGRRVLSVLFEAERDSMERRVVRALGAEIAAAWGAR